MSVYRVGHPAGKGPNSMKVARSRAEAMAELRNRGVKRDDAREMLARADLGRFSTGRGGSHGFDAVEVIKIGQGGAA